MKNQFKGLLVSGRLKKIKDYCRNKSVLDIGNVQHKADYEQKEEWLYGNLKEVASDLIGVDIVEKEVKKLQKKGYNIIVENAESMRLEKEFDVITAGEVIEHLSNLGLFLENMHHHLNSEGVLIITTPNAFAFRYQIRHLLFGKVIPNPQHTFYFDFFTLKEICERHSFKIESWYYFYDNPHKDIKYYLMRIIMLFRKSYAPRIMFILKKAS